MRFLYVAKVVVITACASRAPSGQASPATLLSAASMTFPTADSGVVSAIQYGTGRRGVVLVPGGRFDKTSLESEARALASAGFLVVAIDLRGRGESRGGHAGVDGAYLDVMAAIEHLRGARASPVALVGASLGGWAAAEASMRADSGDVDRLVLLAHAAVDHPERINVPALFIVAEGDTTAAGVPRLVRIREQYNRASGPKQLVVLEGSAHGQLLFQTVHRERVLRQIIAFLSAR
jgi:alpha-beta hydrolase superfamily lysophospholipase